MSLKVDLIANEEKLAALDYVLDQQLARTGRNDPTHMALRAIRHDMVARMEFARSNMLGEIERALKAVHATVNVVGRHDTGKLVFIAYTVMKHWPALRQALEHFGEISAE